MAATITEETYMNVQWKDATGEKTRLLRIDNPRTDTTRATVTTALEPVLFPTISGTTTVVPFFYDDNEDTYDTAMTQIGDIEITQITKSVTKLV